MSGNKQLGDFLRSRRHRLDPLVLGIPAARRRRTPGLRREEVAERAGISCEWYVKLEQGREVGASAETITALARALALDPAETAHLRQIAVRTERQPFVREAVPEIVASIVTGLPQPAYVTGIRWDVLSWNHAADALFGFAQMAESERNILLYMLTDPAARALFAAEWSGEAQRMVALFRATHDQRAGDPAFETLVSRLISASSEFRTWWHTHDVLLPSAGTKTLFFQRQGGETYVYATFHPTDDPTLKLALYALRV